MRGHKVVDRTLLITTTTYVPLVVFKRALGATIGWKDATSAATITLEFTDTSAAPSKTAGDAWEWGDSGETITGPVGSAAGVTLLEVENLNHRRARLKIVTTAESIFEIWDYDGEEY